MIKKIYKTFLSILMKNEVLKNQIKSKIITHKAIRLKKKSPFTGTQ